MTFQAKYRCVLNFLMMLWMKVKRMIMCHEMRFSYVYSMVDYYSFCLVSIPYPPHHDRNQRQNQQYVKLICVLMTICDSLFSCLISVRLVVTICVIYLMKVEILHNPCNHALCHIIVMHMDQVNDMD